MLRVVNPRIKDLHPLENSPALFVSLKIICIFEIFIELLGRWALLMQGTHIVYKTFGSQWVIERFCPYQKYL
jgi:hypothetical protein